MKAALLALAMLTSAAGVALADGIFPDCDGGRFHVEPHGFGFALTQPEAPMTRHVLAALSHDGHARAFLDQPRREIAMRAAMIALETVAHRIQALRRETAR